MHARIEHLLSLRDGEPGDAAIRVHVAACERCGTALAEARHLRDRLQTLPVVAPAMAPGGWQSVIRRKAQREAATRAWGQARRAAVAASVAIVAVAVSWRMADAPTETPASRLAALAPLAAEEALAHDRVAQLQRQSAALEDMLAAIGQRPAVQRAGTALPIDTLESQVQWIDHRLLGSGDDAFASEQLWRERVQTMDSLVRLRYVEAQRTATM